MVKNKKKKIIIGIVAGAAIVSSAVGISLGVYFSNVKKPDPPVTKLIFNTFYSLNRDKEKIKWEIDTLDYKVEFLNQSENNSSRLYFSVDNIQGFYDDCIRPYISSSLVEYVSGSKKVRLLFYDKSPVYYSEEDDTVLMYAYGSEMGYRFLTPFFQDPNTMSSSHEPVTLDYPSSSLSLNKRNYLFLHEINLYVKLENFDDAKSIFEKHLDPNSYLIDSSEKSIVCYLYDAIEYYYEGDQRFAICGFDKNVYAKYTFNDDSIVFTFYDRYYEDSVNNKITK